MRFQILCFTLLFFGLFCSLYAQTLQYSGYIGGTDFESIRDVTTDQEGNIYVTGGTTSADYHTTAGAYQTIHNPGPPDNSSISTFDVFVTKLDPAGNIIWSTFRYANENSNRI